MRLHAHCRNKGGSKLTQRETARPRELRHGYLTTEVRGDDLLDPRFLPTFQLQWTASRLARAVAVGMQSVRRDRGRYVIDEQHVRFLRVPKCRKNREAKFTNDNVIDSAARIMDKPLDPRHAFHIGNAV
jgi:hypothetical protein